MAVAGLGDQQRRLASCGAVSVVSVRAPCLPGAFHVPVAGSGTWAQ
ncbi:hypothetical protein [Streptomyces sp. NPDC021212]